MIYIIVLFSLMSAQTLTFFIARKIKNPSIVDLTWALCLTFFPVCLIWSRSNSVEPLLAITLSVLIILWGLRLSGHIFMNRILISHIDKRYLDILPQKVSQSWFYFFNFQFQAILISLLLMPFYQLPERIDYRWSFIIGVLCAILGLNIEMRADEQLEEFKKISKTEVCDKGLWAYSRHPNYFGEFLFWFGIALCCFQNHHHHWIFISPACLLFIFYFITGPITEAGSIQRKGVLYTQYQKKVPFLFPRTLRFWSELLLFESIKKKYHQ
jgi:steroid 5-alpha reductase family enzyme